MSHGLATPALGLESGVFGCQGWNFNPSPCKAAALPQSSASEEYTMKWCVAFLKLGLSLDS